MVKSEKQTLKNKRKGPCYGKSHVYTKQERREIEKWVQDRIKTETLSQIEVKEYYPYKYNPRQIKYRASIVIC